MSRVESAKDRAANKEQPAQSGWRAGEILRFEYMRVVLDLSFRELRRLHHRPQAASQRGVGHVCGCPTLDPWAKSSGATGEPGAAAPERDRQCGCRRRLLGQNRRSTQRAGKPRTGGRAVGLAGAISPTAGSRPECTVGWESSHLASVWKPGPTGRAGCCAKCAPHHRATRSLLQGVEVRKR